MDSNTQIIKEEEKAKDLISQHIDDGELAIFCGAGISMDSGIMGAEELIKKLLDYYGCSPKEIETYLEKGLPIPFEGIIQSLKKSTYFKDSPEGFIDVFSKLFEATPNNNHHLLAELLKSKKIKYIVTTNFDTCIEDSLEWGKNNENVIIPYEMKEKDVEDIHKLEGKIIKLHGCKTKPNTLGATVEQITKTIYHNRTKIILRKIFAENNCKTILFLGYSCSDKWDIVEYLKETTIANLQFLYLQYDEGKPIDKMLINSREMLSNYTQNTQYIVGNTSNINKAICKHYEIQPIERPKDKKEFLLDKYKVGNPHFVLGRLFYTSENNTLAENYYNEALAIRRTLSKANPKTYIPDVATTLNNLAALHYAKNDYDKAEIYYNEALAIRRTLAEANPKTYSPDVANTLNNLAILHSDRNDYDKAEHDYKEALGIYRTLAEANPKTYIPYVATTLNNLAILHKDKNDYDKAEIYYNEALGIRRTLAEANPQTYIPYVANTLNNLAVLHADKNDYDKAEHDYNEALAIRRTLAEANPKTYSPYVANTLNNLAALHAAKNDYDKAEIYYNEALGIYRTLAEANPKTYSPYVATTLNNLAVLHADKNDYDKAEIYYNEALAIRRTLAEANPKTYIPYVADTLNNLAVLHKNKNDYDKAEIYYNEALEIRRTLSKANPKTYIPYVADTLNNLAVLHAAKNDYDKAEIYYNEALAIRRVLSKANPRAYGIDYAKMLLMGIELFKRNKSELKEAKEILTQFKGIPRAEKILEMAKQLENE